MKARIIYKRAVSAVAAGGMLISCLPLTAAADEAKAVKAIKDQFNYTASEAGDKATGTFYYSTDFFDVSAKQLNPQLRTLSFDLAMAVNRACEGGYTSFCDDFICKLGADESSTVYYDMEGDGNRETLGVMLTNIYDPKENRVIVTAAVRGYGYGNEWASNLDVGLEGDLAGMSEAAQLLTSRIKDYIDNYCSWYGAGTDVKLWITGYSRGGCVSELAGKYINEQPAAYRVSEDDLYVYTFDAPAASSEKTEYANIHNVYDPNSILNVVFPEVWGIYHCGVPEPLQTEDMTVTHKILSITNGFELVDKPEYDENYNELPPVQIRAEDFNKEIIDWLGTTLDRETFNTYYPVISRAVEMFAVRSQSGRKQLGEYFQTLLGLASKDEDFFLTLFSLLAGSDKAADLDAIFQKYVDEANAGGYMTETEIADIKTMLRPTIDLLTLLVRADTENGLDHVLSLMGNIGDIIKRHHIDSLAPIVEANDEWHINDVAVEPGDFYIGVKQLEWDKSDLTTLKKYGATDKDLEQLAKGYNVVYTSIITAGNESKDDAVERNAGLAKYGKLLGSYDLEFYRSSNPDGSAKITPETALDVEVPITLHLYDVTAADLSGLRIVKLENGKLTDITADINGHGIIDDTAEVSLEVAMNGGVTLYVFGGEAAPDKGYSSGSVKVVSVGGSPNLGKVPVIRNNAGGSGFTGSGASGEAPAAPAAAANTDASPATGKAAGCAAAVSLIGIGYSIVRRRNKR